MTAIHAHSKLRYATLIIPVLLLLAPLTLAAVPQGKHTVYVGISVAVGSWVVSILTNEPHNTNTPNPSSHTSVSTLTPTTPNTNNPSDNDGTTSQPSTGITQNKWLVVAMLAALLLFLLILTCLGTRVVAIVAPAATKYAAADLHNYYGLEGMKPSTPIPAAPTGTKVWDKVPHTLTSASTTPMAGYWNTLKVKLVLDVNGKQYTSPTYTVITVKGNWALLYLSTLHPLLTEVNYLIIVEMIKEKLRQMREKSNSHVAVFLLLEGMRKTV